MQCFEDDGDVWYSTPVLEEWVDSYTWEAKGLLWEEESEPQPLLLEIQGLGHLVWWVRIGVEVQHLAWLNMDVHLTKWYYGLNYIPSERMQKLGYCLEQPYRTHLPPASLTQRIYFGDSIWQ